MPNMFSVFFAHTLLVFFLLHRQSVAIPKLQKGSFIGCFKEFDSVENNELGSYEETAQCIDACTSKYFRYSLIKEDEKCTCTNILGDIQDSGHCKEFCDGCELNNTISDAYFNAVHRNGPPRNFEVTNITDREAYLSWSQPVSFNVITNYKVVAKVLATYSHSLLYTTTWMYSNNTFKASIVSLHPGTKYNLTLQAVSPEEGDALTGKVFETKIGAPDMNPKPPKMIGREGSKLKIQLEPISNNNGPVSSYLIIVIDADSVQAIRTENLKPYRQANIEGSSYYIAAEIQPQRINEIFTVGDGKVYGSYYNAPLIKENNYRLMLGMVSRTNGDKIVVYSEPVGPQTDIEMKHLSIYNPTESSPMIVLLSLGIVLISLLLVVGLIGFYLLRIRIENQHRQRLTNNHELSIQGPMIDVENNGYIHDDELGSSSSTNHYQSLNEQVWIIPRNLLNIEHTVLVGLGKFGRIHRGTLLKDDQVQSVSVYSIADKKLLPSEKRSMLLDLDVLIKTKGNANVLSLVGTCESVDTVCVVLERINEKDTTLKEYLLSVRTQIGPRFCTLSEMEVIELSIGICAGMEFLHQKNVVHGSLCSSYICMALKTPKIAGIGLSKFHKNECIPNCDRYSSREVCKGAPHTAKSDVWSFGCLLWEVSCLGGTLHAAASNEDVRDKIAKGLIPPQLCYIYDPLYQMMLNCWQFDSDERPTFAEMRQSLEMSPVDTLVNFNTYPGFQLEPYIHDYEFNKGTLN